MLSFLLLLFSTLYLNAQDSIVPQASVSEQTNLDFQESFFNAITEKAINNHQKAIESLEECNRLMPNNKAILFELSKNYLKLNKINEAVEYANQALVLEEDNIWILEHLVEVFKKGYQFSKAIEVQKNIAKKHPKKKQNLVFLHLHNGDTNSAKKVLKELADLKMLNSRLRNIQERLNAKQKKAEKPKQAFALDLENQFKKNNSFATLQKLLKKFDAENNPSLLAYSEKGLTLFPAQPFVYLMNGKALNKKLQHKKAIESLQNGIDFVIDNNKMEDAFYNELIKAYKSLGDAKNVKKYRKKLKS